MDHISSIYIRNTLRVIFVLSLAVLAWSIHGCAGSAVQTQAVVTDRIARAANTALPTIVQAYRAQGDAAIQIAPDRAGALSNLATVRLRWAPVWEAWAALRALLDTYATGLEAVQAGTSTTATLGAIFPRVQVAWCALVRALPTTVTPPPAISGMLCP